VRCAGCWGGGAPADAPLTPRLTVRRSVWPRFEGIRLQEKFEGPFILNGWVSRDAQESLATGEADAIAFGRPFTANPDLVERFADGLPRRRNGLCDLLRGRCTGLHRHVREPTFPEVAELLLLYADATPHADEEIAPVAVGEGEVAARVSAERTATREQSGQVGVVAAVAAAEFAEDGPTHQPIEQTMKRG